MPTRTLWFMGAEIKVRLVRTIGDAWADHTPGQDALRVSRDQSLSARTESLYHEMLHIAFEKLGLWQELKGRSRKEKDDTEERFIRTLSPVLLAFLKDNGVDVSPLEKVVR